MKHVKKKSGSLTSLLYNYACVSHERHLRMSVERRVYKLVLAIVNFVGQKRNKPFISESSEKIVLISLSGTGLARLADCFCCWLACREDYIHTQWPNYQDTCTSHKHTYPQLQLNQTLPIMEFYLASSFLFPLPLPPLSLPFPSPPLTSFCSTASRSFSISSISS